MIVTIVYIQIKEPYIPDFIDATLFNHRHSVEEYGNLRFDFLQDADDPTKFVLYEAYESPRAAADHKLTAHYKTWCKLVDPWMAVPRKGVKYEVVAPLSPDKW
ncbi:MAG: antibiotic biosynthesis monooxygenase [Bacteroidetes bacterium]|nr:MAG: antibiotic biosynthesis monooxygenase [Bacteroidota bacterium]